MTLVEQEEVVLEEEFDEPEEIPDTEGCSQAVTKPDSKKTKKYFLKWEKLILFFIRNAPSILSEMQTPTLSQSRWEFRARLGHRTWNV